MSELKHMTAREWAEAFITMTTDKVVVNRHFPAETRQRWFIHIGKHITKKVCDKRAAYELLSALRFELEQAFNDCARQEREEIHEKIQRRRIHA